jgi:hypothetical protein
MGSRQTQSCKRASVMDLAFGLSHLRFVAFTQKSSRHRFDDPASTPSGAACVSGRM